MRTSRVMRFLSLLVLCAQTGCSHAHYQWSSDRGRECFYGCQRGRYACYGGCNYNNAYQRGWCEGGCDQEERQCYATCPDLALVASRTADSPESKAYQQAHDRSAFEAVWKRFLSRLDSDQLALLRSYLLEPNSATRSAAEAALDPQSKGDFANLAHALERNTLPIARNELLDNVDHASIVKKTSNQ